MTKRLKVKTKRPGGPKYCEICHKVRMPTNGLVCAGCCLHNVIFINTLRACLGKDRLPNSQDLNHGTATCEAIPILMGRLDNIAERQ